LIPEKEQVDKQNLGHACLLESSFFLSNFYKKWIPIKKNYFLIFGSLIKKWVGKHFLVFSDIKWHEK